MAEASRPLRERPLSPHLQVWRWHVTMAASISNRAGGVALYAGWLVLAGLALAIASGPQAYAAFAGVLTSIPGLVVLFAITAALFFHLAAGVRHLFWDAGLGFRPLRADATALAAYAIALVGSIGVFVLALGGRA